MTPIPVPQLGNEISEAEVTEWVAADGAAVSQGDVVAVITTTKMAMEIEAPASGTLVRLAGEGDLLVVGALLGEIR